MHVFERTYDPLTGMRTTIGTQDGKLVVKQDQDVAPSLDHSTGLRNNNEYSAAGIKKNMWHCVHIPEAVALQMLMEDGFDVYTENARDVRKFLSRNKAKYGYLFTTAGKF
jgi:hypothetical protein